jgi:hypothetical protein
VEWEQRYSERVGTDAGNGEYRHRGDHERGRKGGGEPPSNHSAQRRPLDQGPQGSLD